MADWLQNFPTLDEGALRALKKSFDAGYRAFSRQSGDPIESFFDPLLKAGADPNARSKFGYTPLHRAAAFNQTLAVAAKAKED